MRYYQCKCGELTAWSSMGVPRCLGCPKCGSDLAEGPNAHMDPRPHDFTASDSTEFHGQKLTATVCRYCRRTPEEIDAEGRP
jgi:hypothetical protein